MIALGLMIGALVLLVGGIVVVYAADQLNYGSLRSMILGSCLVPIVVGCISIIAFTATWPTVYFESLNRVNDLEAFQYETMPAYLYAIEQTEDVAVEQSEAGYVDIAYQEQGGFISERIKELRDKVDWYNSTLKGLRARDGTIAGIWMAEVPKELQPIILTVER